MDTKKKVGIITFHASYNYGSMFQAYALQRTIKSMGYDTKIINFRSQIQQKLYSFFPRYKGKLEIGKGLIKCVLFLPFKKKSHRFELFMNRYLDLTPAYSSVEEIETLCPEFDIYVSGSDQIWNPEALDFNEAYLLSFAKDHKRVAYAVSCGPIGNFEDTDWEKMMKKHLARYQAISVREQKTEKLVAKFVGHNVPILLDPTMLLSSAQWDMLLHDMSPILSRKYILLYTLYDNSSLSETVKKISRFLKLPVVVTKYLSKKKALSTYIRCINKTGSGPLEFLWLLKNAEFVISSSFHGTAFSILYNKPFFSYNGNIDARISSLLQMTELSERSINNENVMEKIHNAYNIDFSYANTAIQKEREKSLHFLSEALKL